MADTSNNIEAAPRAGPSADFEETHARNAAAKQRGLEPPEILRSMTDEERAEFEKKLRRKIDIRLLPMIIIMYILNYIDRCVFYMRQMTLSRRGLTANTETISQQRVSQASRRISISTRMVLNSR